MYQSIAELHPTCLLSLPSNLWQGVAIMCLNMQSCNQKPLSSDAVKLMESAKPTMEI